MIRSHRRFALLAVTALATLLAACNPRAGGLEDVSSAPQTEPPSVAQDSPEVSPSANPSPVETPPSAEPTADPAAVLAADGIGPYVIGASLSELQAQALVANVEPSFNCDASWQSAQATGTYATQLTFTFDRGRLDAVHTDSSDLVTPSGGRVGMLLGELQSIHGSRATLITGVNGNQAVSVREPGTALGTVFFLNDTNTTVRAISAGNVQRLEQSVVVGEGC